MLIVPLCVALAEEEEEEGDSKKDKKQWRAVLIRTVIPTVTLFAVFLGLLLAASYHIMDSREDGSHQLWA
jgi:hypothetical protein